MRSLREGRNTAGNSGELHDCPTQDSQPPRPPSYFGDTEPRLSVYGDDKPTTIVGPQLKGGSSSFPTYGWVEARRVTETDWSVSFDKNYGGDTNYGLLPFADALRKMHEVHMAQKAVQRSQPHPNEPKHFWVVEEPLHNAPANNLYLVANRYGIALDGAPQVKQAAQAVQPHSRGGMAL